MVAFCGEESFWNTSLTWGDDRSYPGFTECFQDTVLLWIPSGWLWLTMPFNIHHLRSQTNNILPKSWKNLSKMFIALLQLVILVLILSFRAVALTQSNRTWFQAYLIGPLVEALTICLFVKGNSSVNVYFDSSEPSKRNQEQFEIAKERSALKRALFLEMPMKGKVLVAVYIEMDRRKGQITSGVLFVYWALANITFIIPFYIKIIEQVYIEKPLDFSLFIVYYFLSLTQLVLSSIAETLPIPEGKKPCPQLRSSFLSRITFQWIQPLVVAGYKKPLTEDDMFLLNPLDQSTEVVKAFEYHWKQEEMKINKKLAENTSSKERSSEGSIQENIKMSEAASQLDNTTDVNRRISLLAVLFKTFGWDLFLSNIPMLLNNIIIFVNPFLLQLLIEFTEDSHKPMWKGFLYSAAFFVVIAVQSFCFHIQMHNAMTVGIRIRSALMSAVFQKSLRINNRARAESTTGEIVNLMSVDTEQIQEMMTYIWEVWSIPLQIIASIVYLYFAVGYAMFAGLGVLILVTSVNVISFKKIKQYEADVMERKDDRIKLTTEILNGIKILKLYAWELTFGEKVTEIRDRELSWLLKREQLFSVTQFSWTVAPFTVGLATFATYIYTEEDHKFDAKAAFVAVTLFNILRFGLTAAPMTVQSLVKTLVSVQRMGKFLNNENLNSGSVSHEHSESAISVEDGTFCWDPELGPCLKDINMKIPKGSLVAIVGAVGAGKTSLVSAFLGEMDKVKGQVNVDGSKAYVSQQAWIQNTTVKDNIVFGQQVDTKRYQNIIEACALQSDLDIFQAGDMTEIGEKGINLSGGQKQRVSLARAVYFDSDIYLLDDPLSAVDSHVGKHIFQNVIGKQGILNKKTRVLVTHGIHWLPYVDTIFVVTNGGISEVGPYNELLSHDGAFAKFLQTYLMEHEESEDEESDEEVKETKAVMLQLARIQSDGEFGETKPFLKRSRSQKGSESDKSHTDEHKRASKRQDDIAKLVEEEELEVGRVHWSVVMSYARAVGLKSFTAIILLYGFYQGFSVWASIWLTTWTSDPELQNLTLWPANSSERRNKNDYYLGIYGTFGIAQGVFSVAFTLFMAYRCVEAAKHFHKEMLVNVLRGPMSFFDTTPVGRIVNRFSQDVQAIDSTLPNMLMEIIPSIYLILSTVIVISYSTPIFITVIIPVGLLYFILQRFYIPTSRQLQRLESKTRSPIYNNFSESLTGASVIRAFQVQDRFIKESERRVDFNHEYDYASITVNSWIGFRLEVIGAIIVFASSLFAVIERNNISGALVGLSVSYALQITDNLNWLVQMISEFETNIVSVERVRQFTETPTEAPLHTTHRPDESWPDKGQVQLESYSTRYRKGLSLVLKRINVSINPGEKIGIVGRTGAGKSSLTLSLFRLIEPSSGRILVDGQDISHLGLLDLRSRLTILPQEPILFSGSLRMNLDPLADHDDSAIWTALEQCHLKSFVGDLPAKLEYEVGEGGQNLSMGQRQLMCLARSLLRKSKILVLDEATAAVDLETDALIQNAINTEFRDYTVLTIAHRLNTVMDYDRILVLRDGEVQEFDAPKSLLQDSSSAFYSMAKDAGLV